MGIDFSGLLAAFNQIAVNINTFFAGIFNSVTQVANTGQGIYSGLVNFGGWIYQGLKDAFMSIYNGLAWVGNQFFAAYQVVASAFGNAINFIGTNIYNFGQWVWAGIQGFANMIANGVIYIANQIYNFLVGAWNTIYTAIIGFQTTLNNWWGGLMVSIRNKIKASIIFSLTTHIAWASAEGIPQRLMSSKTPEEMGVGMLGALAGICFAPIPGVLLAEMLDFILPTPTTTYSPITPPLPSISLTPPTLEPQAPAPSTPTTPGVPQVGVNISPSEMLIQTSEQPLTTALVVPIQPTGFTEDEEPLTMTVTVSLEAESI